MYKLNNVLHFLQDFNTDVMSVLKRKRKVFKDFRKSKSNLFTVVSYVNMYPEILNKMDYSSAEIKTMLKYFGTLSEAEIGNVVEGLWSKNKEYVPLADTTQNIPQIKQIPTELLKAPVVTKKKVVKPVVNDIVQQKLQKQKQLQIVKQQSRSKQQWFQEPSWMQQMQQGYQQLPTGTVNIEIDFAGTRAIVDSNFKAEKVRIEGDVIWSNVSNSWEFLADDKEWNRRQSDFYEMNKRRIDELVDTRFISLQQFVN